MKTGKRLLALFLALLLLAPSGAVARADDLRACAVIGADLTEEQIEEAYFRFGVARGSVPELKITNEEERSALQDFVDESVIGRYSLSCVYLELLDEGRGMSVATDNISWCSPAMYMSALATAGITDARLVVTAPVEVSGTAALAGISKAYESITGEKLEEVNVQVSTQELTVTGELAEEIGEEESTGIVNDMKLLLDETRAMSDDELRETIRSVAGDYGVSLTDTQLDQLISLCRALEKLDGVELKSRVDQIQSTLRKLSEAKDQVVGFVQSVKKTIEAIRGFFEKLGRLFGK